MSWKDTVKVNKGLLSSWTNQMNMKTINESYAEKSLNGVPYREKQFFFMGRGLQESSPFLRASKWCWTAVSMLCTNNWAIPIMHFTMGRCGLQL